MMVWRFLKKTKSKTTIYPAISLLGMYPKETKIEKDTCILLFTAALFSIARTQKQPRCPLTDEWIKKLWYIYTTEYYLAIKRNTFESVLMRWMNLEPIIPNKVSQKEEDKYCILMHIYRIQKNGTEEFIYRTAVEKQTQRIQAYEHGERGGEGEMYRKSSVGTYITICKIDSQWEFAVWLRKLKQGLCQPRGVGWGGRWEGGSKGRRYVYAYG